MWLKLVQLSSLNNTCTCVSSPHQWYLYDLVFGFQVNLPPWWDVMYCRVGMSCTHAVTIEEFPIHCPTGTNIVAESGRLSCFLQSSNVAEYFMILKNYRKSNYKFNEFGDSSWFFFIGSLGNILINLFGVSSFTNTNQTIRFFSKHNAVLVYPWLANKGVEVASPLWFKRLGISCFEIAISTEILLKRIQVGDVQKREIFHFTSCQRGKFCAKTFRDINFVRQNSNSAWIFGNDEIFPPYDDLKLIIWSIAFYYCILWIKCMHFHCKIQNNSLF